MRAHLLLSIGLLSLVGLGVSTACTVSVTSDVPVHFEAYGTCTTAGGYALISGDYGTYCGDTFTCSDDYYALCDGTAWDGCACDLPSGAVVISWSDYGSGYIGAGDDGGSAGDDGPGGEAGSETGSGDDGGTETGSGTEAGSGDDGGGGGDSGGGGGDDGGGGGGG